MGKDLFGSDYNLSVKENSLSITTDVLVRSLIKILESNDLNFIKSEISNLLETCKISSNVSTGNILSEEKISGKRLDFLIVDIQQIIDAQSLERTKYYIKRLLKSLTSKREGKINDLDLNRWKEYEDILTDSLWLMEKRDRSGAHNANYWGNFIPQIPQQLLKRYTKSNEWVLDTFIGSGTTLIECKRLGRNGIGIDLSKEALQTAKQNLEMEQNINDTKTELMNSDSTELNYKEALEKIGINSVQLVIMHPPYWDIIKFSDDEKDLSNAASIDSFLSGIGKIAKKSYSVLDKGRYLALVIGDKYSKGELIPLGFLAMNEVKEVGFKLKSIIVKNFDVTKGKQKQEELWRYRALVGGFYVFKHEYIFLFQKE
jgi:DNA modification methylase